MIALTNILTSAVCAFAAAFATIVGVYAWDRALIPGHKTLSILCACVGIWCLTASIEYVSYDFATRVTLAKLTYLGSGGFSVAWILFVCRFVQRDQWITQTKIALLAFIPAASIILALTNEWHGLIWSEVRYVQSPVVDLDIEHGPWFILVLIPFSYLSLFIGYVLLLREYFRCQDAASKRQYIAILIAPLIAVGANVTYVFSGVSFSGLDPTPVSLAVSIAGMAWFISHQNILRAHPMSYHSVFNHTSDAVIMINQEGDLLNLNPVAWNACAKASPIGLPLEQVFPRFAAIRWRGASDQQPIVTHSVFTKDVLSEIKIRTLRSTSKKPMGHVIFVRELSAQATPPPVRVDTPKHHDDLTGLNNRHWMINKIDELLEANRQVSILFTDLDDFRGINQQYGRAAGDTVLQTFTDRLNGLTPEDAIVGRMGGDEFAIALCNISTNAVMDLAYMLEREMLKPIVVGDQTIRVDLSIGLAQFPADGVTAQELLGQADKRMYWIKRHRSRGV